MTLVNFLTCVDMVMNVSHMNTTTYKTIAFQGALGAYSDLACRTVFPQLETLPCHSFDDAFKAVQDGDADLAMIPVDNTLAGRVADVHHLLPYAGLHIIGEHFQPIQHALLGVPGTQISDLKEVHSHVHALPQCRKVIKELGLKPVVHADTAGAAAEVAQRADKSLAAIASPLAAEIYGLTVLRDNVQDADTNTTRFIVLSRQGQVPASHDDCVTSFTFEVRNIPAALYKAMGGFATNGVQMTKLESYIDETFQVARFYAEVAAHTDEDRLKRAFEELAFFARTVTVLGCYKGHNFRFKSA
jgi:prephenate dehydratase